MKRTRFDVPPERERSVEKSVRTPRTEPNRSPVVTAVDGRQGLSVALQRCATDAFSGCLDAMALLTAANVILRSHKILMRTARCLILNGVIFVGSIYLFDLAVVPTMRWLWLLSGGDGTLGTYFESLLHGVYYLLWVYPIYAFSFVLNSWWHQEIADAAYKDQIGAPSEASSYGQVRQRVADEIFRAIMVLVYLVEAAAVRFVPLVGTLLSFALLAWMYSFYSFEYKWQNKGWDLAQRVAFFETHWAYFLGFGFPCTMLTFFSPQFVSGGVFAMIFPVFIVMANKAIVQPPGGTPTSSRILGSVLPSRMPIFALSWRITSAIVRRMHARSSQVD